jgi:hypothetical protein
MSALIVASETLLNTYYLFRPLGNKQYLEIKFEVTNKGIVSKSVYSLKESEKDEINKMFYETL